MQQIHNCPVCNSDKFTKDLICKDYTVSQEIFQLVICSACGFKFTNPRPEDSVIGKYYKSEDYISHSDTRKGLISKLYHAVRNYTLKKKLQLVNKYVSRGTILDYGCGTGMFLNICQEDKWKVVGIEPDKGARAIASKKISNLFPDKEELLKQNPDGKFEAITLWHVLEHVTDLNETLEVFKQHLLPKGVLIIAVPNYMSLDAQHYREYWAAYDVPRHLYHFEIKSISSLLAKYGFSLLKTYPMKFDSFYVSLLSEKYKEGKVNYWNAFKMGLKSNLKSKKAEDYSSVIYIFQSR